MSLNEFKRQGKPHSKFQKKLKGTNIFNNEDLCEASQTKRRAQFLQLKQDRSQGKIILIL